MANIKSAIKRVGVTNKKNLRNRMIVSAMKTAIKRFEKAVEAGDKTAVSATYTNAVSVVDKACAKGVIHKNNANRKKAQLTKKLDAAK